MCLHFSYDISVGWFGHAILFRGPPHPSTDRAFPPALQASGIMDTLPRDVLTSFIEFTPSPVDTACVFAQTCSAIAAIARQWIANVQHLPRLFSPAAFLLDNIDVDLTNLKRRLCVRLRMLTSLTTIDTSTSGSLLTLDDCILNSVWSKKLQSISITATRDVKVSLSAVNSLVHRNSSLTSLTLRNFSSSPDFQFVIKNMKKKCLKLTDVDISGCKCEVHNLNNLDLYPALTRLNLSNSATRYLTLDNCLMLRYLDLSNTMISNAIIEIGIAACTLLEYLGMSQQTHDYITPHGVQCALLNFRHLKTIIVSTGVKIRRAFVSKQSSCAAWPLTCLQVHQFNVSDIEDEDVDVVRQSCTNLTSLDIAKCTSLSTLALTRTIDSLSALASLRLGDARNLDDTCLHSLSKRSQLRYVSISFSRHLTDDGICALASHCPLLEHVDVNWCGTVGQVGIAALLEKCPWLSHLGACGCELHDMSECTTDAKDTFALTHLDLDSCDKVTNLGALLCKCPHMRILELRKCYLLRNSDMDVISYSCPLLHKLDVFGCYDVTDVSQVIRRCIHLEAVGLGYSVRTHDTRRLALSLGRDVKVVVTIV